MKRFPQVWANSQQILAMANAGEEHKIDRGEAWIRQMCRIAKLPAEIGRELDQLRANFSQCRHVAYGRTTIEQRRRLAEVRLEIAPRASQLPLRPGPSLVRALGVNLAPELEDALKEVPAAKLDEFVQAILAAPKKKSAA